MKVNYYQKSIFLAGPTPRSEGVKSWRPNALEILSSLGFDGVVYVPEHKEKAKYFYDDQVEWERAGLMNAQIIIFWVPREIETMPAFTTNVEFGYYLAKSPSKVVYGRPNDAPKNRYLDWLYGKETNKKPASSLDELLNEAIKLF